MLLERLAVQLTARISVGLRLRLVQEGVWRLAWVDSVASESRVLGMPQPQVSCADLCDNPVGQDHSFPCNK
jgi:hypothetical protein